MAIEQAFNSSIDYYDNWMKKALPNYSDIFKTAQEIIPFTSDNPINVLDLGAGTGLFSKHILERYPHAHFILYDLADKMLDVAKERFKSYPKQFEYIIGDYRNIQISSQFDLVISSLSIHHLNDNEKSNLFHTIYSKLRSPGLFMNIDQIRAETHYLRKLYWDHWLKQVRQQELLENQIQDSINRRETYDQDALMSDQLQWLSEAGFVNVDCIYKNYFVGVFHAMKE
jgi:tRNA (cmo5U34)-methyltransferase